MTDETQSRLSAREVAAEYATGTVFDITECARESIHLLGSVQSHGALLALAEPDLTITVASANTAAVLGVHRTCCWVCRLQTFSAPNRPGSFTRQLLMMTASPR
jgi:hypothetical protein